MQFGGKIRILFEKHFTMKDYVLSNAKLFYWPEIAYLDAAYQFYLFITDGQLNESLTVAGRVRSISDLLSVI